MKKTNVMRILDAQKIEYTTYEYTITDGKTDGLTVAAKVGQDPEKVFKTLVTRGHSKEYYVFVIPVGQELNLKKAAVVTQEKKIEMIAMKELLPLTGYVHGGCSPIGMKKKFATFLHESAKLHESIIFSAGKIGAQVELKVDDLLQVIQVELVDLVSTP
ncbi:MAG: Cys-tRNA(Pro) deacylase [Vallitaleaceae bacterium]|nr:Cys-tRNA(Pro) deacylase [Vallitaleaceae bacterium]